MTNAEKFLKDGVDVDKIAREIDIIFQNDENVANAEQATIKYFNSTCKPQLTEDERVILRNINKQFIKVGRDSANTIYFVFEEFTGNEAKYYANVFDNVFQFIKYGEEYEIAELLKGE